MQDFENDHNLLCLLSLMPFLCILRKAMDFTFSPAQQRCPLGE